MPLTDNAKALIADYVRQRKEGYFDLSDTEKTKLVTDLLRNSPKYDKAGVLSDADYDILLPDLIADVIAHQASEPSVKKLIDGIMAVFVRGTKTRQAAFYHDIEECFEEEWEEQWGEPDDNWVYDCVQRSRDAGGP